MHLVLISQKEIVTATETYSMSVERVVETIQLVWTAVVLSTETGRLVTVHVDLADQGYQLEIVIATETYSMSVAFVAELGSRKENVTAKETY